MVGFLARAMAHKAKTCSPLTLGRPSLYKPLSTSHDGRSRHFRTTLSRDAVSAPKSQARARAHEIKRRRHAVRRGMVMYRFEIHCEEGPDNCIRYSWELRLATSDDKEEEEVVVGRRYFLSLAEAQSEVRAFRRAVARARMEESPACLQYPEPRTVYFRRMPNVVSLPATMSGRHDPHAAKPGPGRHHLCVPAAAEAAVLQAEAETQDEAEAQADAEVSATPESSAVSESSAAPEPSASGPPRKSAGTRASRARRSTSKAT